MMLSAKQRREYEKAINQLSVIDAIETNHILSLAEKMDEEAVEIISKRPSTQNSRLIGEAVHKRLERQARNSEYYIQPHFAHMFMPLEEQFSGFRDGVFVEEMSQDSYYKRALALWDNTFKTGKKMLGAYTGEGHSLIVRNEFEHAFGKTFPLQRSLCGIELYRCKKGVTILDMKWGEQYHA